MNIKLEDLLHPQIEQKCIKLLKDGHFKHAALEAMIQVELSLKDKGFAPPKKFGEDLIKWIFGSGENIKLRIPFGEELQNQANQLFKGAFSYYRNYSAHDGAKIDKRSSIRILILASELLELLDASHLSLEGLGGYEGLIKLGAFSDVKELIAFLELLDNIIVIDEAGEISEELGINGFSDKQYTLALNLGLCEYVGKYIRDPETLEDFMMKPTNPIGGTRLTEQGINLLDILKRIEANQ
jgi:uncharacterized protein (TIGR02391 family)